MNDFFVLTARVAPKCTMSSYVPVPSTTSYQREREFLRELLEADVDPLDGPRALVREDDGARVIAACQAAVKLHHPVVAIKLGFDIDVLVRQRVDDRDRVVLDAHNEADGDGCLSRRHAQTQRGVSPRG